MNEKALDLLLKRERLRDRIRNQRSEVARHSWPVADVLAVGDQVTEGVHFLRERPLFVAAGALLVALLRPRRIINWGKRGFIVWQLWRGVRQKLRKVLVALKLA